MKLFRKYKTLVCDLDGTLVETGIPYILSVIGKTAQDIERVLSDEEMIGIWLRGDRERYIKGLGIDPELFWTNFRRYDNASERIKLTRPFSDYGFLKIAKMHGAKIGIVTDAPLDIARMEIALLGDDIVDYFVASGNGFRFKPHPEGLEHCLEKLDAEKETTIYCGDTHTDIETAQNVGVDSALIRRSEHPYNGPKPTYEIQTLDRLAPLLGIQFPKPLGERFTREKTQKLMDDLTQVIAKSTKIDEDLKRIFELERYALQREYELRSGERF